MSCMPWDTATSNFHVTAQQLGPRQRLSTYLHQRGLPRSHVSRRALPVPQILGFNYNTSEAHHHVIINIPRVTTLTGLRSS